MYKFCCVWYIDKYTKQNWKDEEKMSKHSKYTSNQADV